MRGSFSFECPFDRQPQKTGGGEAPRAIDGVRRILGKSLPPHFPELATHLPGALSDGRGGVGLACELELDLEQRSAGRIFHQRPGALDQRFEPATQLRRRVAQPGEGVIQRREAPLDERQERPVRSPKWYWMTPHDRSQRSEIRAALAFARPSSSMHSTAARNTCSRVRARLRVALRCSETAGTKKIVRYEIIESTMI